MPPAEPRPPDSFPGKTEARAWARDLLRGLSPGDRAARSAAAAERILGMESFRESYLVLAFLSMPSEIDTSLVIRAALRSGKRAAAPRIEGGDIAFAYLDESWESLPRDSLGIPTPPAGDPIPPGELRRVNVFALIPGLLFDAGGGRLGRGKGYYDRFLASVISGLGADVPIAEGPGSAGAPTARPGGGVGFFVPCGFCYEAQVVPLVPVAEGDIRVPRIATEARVLDVPG
jgi:5-formyltetrahydrofolate cyclo-ligase